MDKMDSLIDQLFESNFDSLIDIRIDDDIVEKLYTYQFTHVFNLMHIMKYNNVALDGSDTGTGKTYTSIALAKQLNYKPFIICPKNVITYWKNVCKYFGVDPITVTNYDLIKNGKIYDKKDNPVKKYINVYDDYSDINRFKWNLPRNTLVIFDEAHKCKNKKSLNSLLLLSLHKYIKNYRNTTKIIMLSATISDKPEFFHVFGLLLGFYKNLRQANNWIKGCILEDQSMIKSSKKKLSTMCKAIYPDKGCRMSIKELGNDFPENQISVDMYDIPKNYCNDINNSIKNINNMISSNDIVISKILRERQKIELCKIPIFTDLALNYIENGHSVVIFVNFIETINILKKQLKTKCVIYGELNKKTINDNIDNFQNNKSKIIICMINSGESISLHDTNGNYPRISIISPPLSSIYLKQALGRIYRAGAKSKSLQRIILSANTLEQNLYNKLIDKIDYIDSINDSDLIP